MRKRTRLAHGGRGDPNGTRFVNLPVARASTVLFDSVAHLAEVQRRFDADEAVATYGITNTPLRNAFEDLMVEVEGGHRAVSLPSGLAAVTVALMAALDAGDHVLITDACYGPTRRTAERLLKRYGIEATYYDPCIGAGIAALFRPNTRAVYLENPGSITFEVQDFPAIAKVAHERGAAVLHDNTWATGLYFPSFEHGADLVIQAATKYPGGHSDVMLGAVVANEAWWPRLRDTSRDLGQTASPDDLFLALRGLRTMELRLREQGANALALARRLQQHPKVARVLHPALESDPGHALWKRDFRGASGLFGVEFKPCSEASVAAFIDSLECFGLGYSWGGYESLVTLGQLGRYSRTANPWTGGPLVRLQVGLEDPEDLFEDLVRGFGHLA